MKIRKQVLTQLPDCYAVACFPVDGIPHAFFATDGYGGCTSVNLHTFQTQVVWNGPGGTMSLVPIPGRNGTFLASQRFFPGFQAAESQIVLVTRKNGAWEVSPWLSLPYLHRFDLLEQNGEQYLLCCTLAERKDSVDDWSHPGGLFGCRVDAECSPPQRLERLAGGMTRNHGYYRVNDADGSHALTSCDEGVFEVFPPCHPGTPWRIHRVLDVAASDIATHPGLSAGRSHAKGRLLAVIEPFHGDSLCVYRVDPSHAKQGEMVWRSPYPLPFCHAIWGGTLWGRAAFLFGFREGDKQLLLLSPSGSTASASGSQESGRVLTPEHLQSGVFQGMGEFSLQLLDAGQGPSNVCVLHHGCEEWVLCANRHAGEGVLYVLTP